MYFRLELSQKMLLANPEKKKRHNVALLFPYFIVGAIHELPLR